MDYYEVALGALAVLLATSVGSLAILPFKRIEGSLYSIMLAFSAGVMAYSSVEMLSESHFFAGDIIVLVGFISGLLALLVAERLFPHIHRHMGNEELTDSKKKAAIVVGTIALHNVPEGLAVATAFAASGPLGWFVTTSIAIQDVPEGMMISAPLAAYGISRRWSIFSGIFSGIAEAIAVIIGYAFLSSFSGLIPVALAFSAGAMIYVVFVELLPDAIKNGMERVAAFSFVSGAAIAFLIASLLAV